MSQEMLSDFLKTGEDWGRMKTSIPGVFVIKMPAYRSSPTRLAVEINPVDASGNPTKRRGLYIRFGDELESFREILNEEKLSNLMDMLGSVNPSVEGARRGKSDKIIEL
jgi:hypothetical protein